MIVTSRHELEQLAKPINIAFDKNADWKPEELVKTGFIP